MVAGEFKVYKQKQEEVPSRINNIYELPIENRLKKDVPRQREKEQPPLKKRKEMIEID